MILPALGRSPFENFLKFSEFFISAPIYLFLALYIIVRTCKPVTTMLGEFASFSEMVI